MKILNRNCPVCGRIITYSAERERIDADKNNSKCNYCKIKGRACKESTRQQLRMCNLGKTYSKEINKKKGSPGKQNPMFGKQHSEETKIKISEKAKARKRKSHTVTTKLKMRMTRIKVIKERYGQIVPNYNPVACKLIDEYGQLHEYRFQHAENGGEFYIAELGYWVDGYDKEKNVVIEVDEKHHKKQKQLEKDKQRQEEIINLLQCEFIRIEI